MKRAAASTAARNNGPGGDSAAGASPLTTVDRILDSPATDAEIRAPRRRYPRCLCADVASRKGHERDLGTKLGDRIGVKLRLAEHHVGVLAETGSPPCNLRFAGRF